MYGIIDFNIFSHPKDYLAIQEALKLPLADVERLARNSYRGSFLSPHDKAEALARFDAFRADFSAAW